MPTTILIIVLCILILTRERKKERKKRETTEKSGCKLYFIQPYITSAILLDMKRRDILSEGFMV